LATAIASHAAQALPLKPKDVAAVAAKGKPKRGAFKLFNTVELKTKRSSYARHWNNVVQRVKSEQRFYEACDAAAAKCHSKVQRWRNAVSKMRGLTGYDLLAAANGRANRLITYADDSTHFGRSDHWASPIESLTGRGDCEDYVILKYFTLAELGVPEEDMRIVIVKDMVRRIGHAVLAVRQAGRTYILDSLHNRPRLHSAITRYKPYQSLNRLGSWINVAVRKRSSTRLAAAKLPEQSPAEAQALLPTYARNQATSGSVMLRGSVETSNTIQ
jgi:predicted transglutaminase-like cysteine proteinase